jgi:hypothetical protein
MWSIAIKFIIDFQRIVVHFDSWHHFVDMRTLDVIEVVSQRASNKQKMAPTILEQWSPLNMTETSSTSLSTAPPERQLGSLILDARSGGIIQARQSLTH